MRNSSIRILNIIVNIHSKMSVANRPTMARSNNVAASVSSTPLISLIMAVKVSLTPRATFPEPQTKYYERLNQLPVKSDVLRDRLTFAPAWYIPSISFLSCHRRLQKQCKHRLLGVELYWNLLLDVLAAQRFLRLSGEGRFDVYYAQLRPFFQIRIRVQIILRRSPAPKE